MTDHTMTAPTDAPERETAADRRAKPSFLDIAVAVAEQHGQCVRPIVKQRLDTASGEVVYIAVDCGNTIKSVCGPCAERARKLRIEQCRAGWHMTEEPVSEPQHPTTEQTALVTFHADLVAAYRDATDNDEQDAMEELREEIRSVEKELVESGMRGKFPPLDPPASKARARRSTKRRQDMADLPRLPVAKKTVGQWYAGKFQPSMFVTLTCPSYGRINADGAVDAKGRPCGDGTPVDSGSYDYRGAARDIVHFSALVDRWIQNLRRAVGWEVQYFATVEPQKRGAPHLHIAIRGTIPHKILTMVTAATYHQVWWPNHDQLRYSHGRMPYWDGDRGTFVDPDTHVPLTAWDDALDDLAADEDAVPAHVVRFGTQMDPGTKNRGKGRGILGGTEEAGRHIGYLTKYLMKSVSEVLEASTARQHAHHDRLHAELEITPCSDRCPVWLRYGIVPKGASARTVPGRCKGKAHRRDTLGLPGRRVLNSRKWSGKTLPDHKADRADFVRQLLADVGIVKPPVDAGRFIWLKVSPNDPNVPSREALLMAGVAQRKTWEAEYTRARLAADAPPGEQETSATRQTAV